MKPIEIVFDIEAEKDLKLIFDYLKIKSEKGAKNVLNDIISDIKIFALQLNIRLMNF